MTDPHVQDRPYLNKSRVSNLTLAELVVCSLCDGILWSPVACRKCDGPFCTACIENWHSNQGDASRCPNGCAYVQRGCPPANLHVLKTLQVSCRYSPNGCTETLLYDHVHAHEKTCGYRLMTCSGCEERIVKKDFEEHHGKCPLVVLTCPDCQSTYQRREEINHTDIKCLRVQLQQVRDRAQSKEHEYDEKISSLELQVQALNEIIRRLCC